MPEKVEGFDRVFDLVGSFGWFQGILLACMTLQALLSWHHLSAVFLAAVPPHWCHIPELTGSGWTTEQIRNISIPRAAQVGSQYDWEPCGYFDLDYSQIIQSSGGVFESAYQSSRNMPLNVTQCYNWDWDLSIYYSTVVTDFELVCHRRVLVGTIQATYMGGVLIGSLVLGSLSDQLLGRRGSVLISLGVSLAAGFASGMVASYEAFLLFRFILAAGVAGSYQNCYVLMLEYASPSTRAGFGLVGQLSFAFGYMLLALVAYFFRNWADFQIASSAIGLILIAYYWILPESARWLLYKGEPEKAYKLLKKVAKLNGKPEPSRDAIFEIFKSCQSSPSADGIETTSSAQQNATTASTTINKEKGALKQLMRNVLEVIKIALLNYWNLLRTPEIRKRTLLIWALFIIVDLVYYGVVFDSATLTNDPFMLVFLAGLMEVPAYTLVIPCLTALGRRPTVVGTFFLTAVCSFVVAYIPIQYEIFRVVISMAGKLFITTCFAVLYLLGAELFPTATRTTGLASAVIMGRLGSIMAPFIVDMVKTAYRDLPNVIFGLVSIAAAIISVMLPETRDSEMYDDITALENAAIQPQNSTGNENSPAIIDVEIDPDKFITTNSQVKSYANDALKEEAEFGQS